MAELVNLAPFILLLLAFYLVVIRPARKRQRQLTAFQDSLVPGQEVMTSSGLIGTISAVHDDEVVLEAAPGVQLRWAKAAITRALPPHEASDADVDPTVTKAE